MTKKKIIKRSKLGSFSVLLVLSFAIIGIIVFYNNILINNKINDSVPKVENLYSIGIFGENILLYISIILIIIFLIIFIILSRLSKKRLLKNKFF